MLARDRIVLLLSQEPNDDQPARFDPVEHHERGLRNWIASTPFVVRGADFKVEPKQGLSGFCDFLISQSPLQMAVESPVVAIVEAKHEDLNAGIPQCLAAMYAARLFNEKRGKSLATVYGATTSGTVWRFLRLTGMQAESDLTEYHIHDVDKILGILVHMVS